MRTDKQIEASRLNGQKSNGPRTEAGKAVSSRNALKSGVYATSEVIPGEDAASLEALSREYIDQYQPLTPAERLQVDILIRSDWMLRRFATLEPGVYRSDIDGQFRERKDAVGFAYCCNSNTLSRLHRSVTTNQRAFREALKELERLQAAREAAPNPEPPAAQPAETEPVSESLGSFRQIDSEPPLTPTEHDELPKNTSDSPNNAPGDTPNPCI